MPLMDTEYGAAPLSSEFDVEGERAASRRAWGTRSAGALAVVLLVGAGALVSARRGEVRDVVADVSSSLGASLGQTQTSADKVRQVLVEAFDHLACTQSCKARHDSLAVKVEHDDRALVCADFQKYASEDACVQSCRCEDKTVISTSVDYLCGSNPPDNPEDLHSKTFYEAMTDKVIMMCPPSQ